MASRPPAAPPAAPPSSGGGFLSRWSQRKAQVRQGQTPEEPPATAPTGAARPLVSPAPVAAGLSPATPTAPLPTESAAPAEAAPPAPTLQELAALPADAPDFSRFVARGVQPELKNAALKKMFTDPHFNVMDGLDIYIDDYGRPDPLPASMLRELAQSRFLGLVDEDEDKTSPAVAPTASDIAPVTATATATATATDAATDTAPDRAAAPDAPASAPHSALPVPPGPTADENADLRLQPDDAAGRPGPEPGPGEHAGR